MSVQDFEKVVLGAMAPDNNVRARAEAVFQRARQHPDSFFSLLSQLMQSSTRPEVLDCSFFLNYTSLISTVSGEAILRRYAAPESHEGACCNVGPNECPDSTAFEDNNSGMKTMRIKKETVTFFVLISTF